MKKVLNFCLCLFISSISFSQVNFSTYQLNGSVVQMKADNQNQLHLIESISSLVFIDSVSYQNTLLYSVYDQDFNLIRSTPLLEELSSPASFYFLGNNKRSQLLIDEAGTVHCLLLMRGGSGIQNDTMFSPNCSDCSDFFYAKISNDGQIIQSRMINFLMPNSSGQVMASINQDGTLKLGARITNDAGRIRLSDSTYYDAHAGESVLLDLDQDLKVDTLITSEAGLQEILETSEATYALHDNQLIKYDLNWQEQWRKSFKITEVSSGLSLNPDQSISIGGSFVGSFEIDSSRVSSTSSFDNVVFNISKDGATNWMVFITGQGDDDDLDIATDRFGNTYYFGDFDTDQKFGDVTYRDETNRGRVMGKIINGQPVHSAYVSGAQLPATNSTNMMTSGEYVYVYQNGRNTRIILRTCIKEAKANCNDVFTTSLKATPNNQSQAIYPNPTFDEINIVSNVAPQNIQIYDALGKLVLSPAPQATISLKSLPTGLYILIYQVDQQMYSSKVMKN